MTLRTLARPVLLAGALVSAASCGGSEGPTGPDPSVVTSVTVTPTTATVEVGETVQLSATVLNGLEETVNTPVSWSSAAEGVATVSSSGLVTGVGEGGATITAAAGGESGTAQVTVVDPTPPDAPAGLTATAASHTEMELTWTDASDNEDGFEIEREPVSPAGGATGAEGQAAAFEQVTTVGVGVTSFTDTDLDPATAYRYRVRAINANGASDYTAAAEASTHATLVMETEALPRGALDQPYEEALAASGGAGAGSFSWSQSGGAFPSGLDLSGEGLVSGTPTETGTFTAEITVASGGQTVVRSFELTVQEEVLPPEVVTTALPDASVGTAYSQALEASGGDGTYTWSLVSGSFPAGLSLSAEGVVSGVPTAAGSATVTVEVASADQTATGQVSVTVQAQPLEVLTSSLKDGEVGSNYLADLSAQGGIPPLVWRVAVGAPPAGISLAGDGTLSGEPTVAGTSTFTVTVADDRGEEATAELAITVAPGPVSILTEVLDGGQVGTPYSLALEASGGDGLGFTWSVAGGTPPPGVTLSPDGTLAGTPGAEGTYELQVRAESAGEEDLTSLVLGAVAAPRSGYQVDLVYSTWVGSDMRAVFDGARERWSQLVTADEADEVGGIPGCGSFHPATQATVDDVVIYVTVEEIDGEGGTLGRASPCYVRDGSLLPLTGAMVFDATDVRQMVSGPTSHLLERIILHEMGHVLGIGVLWDNLGLLSGECEVDPIFTGAGAIQAFNKADGTLYSGDPVPVEDEGTENDGSNCSHWRESVLGNELMTPAASAGSNPLSAISVESLADMGYTVDSSAADEYVLPKPVPAGAVAPRDQVFLADDILPIPLMGVGPDGRPRPVGGRR